MKVLKMKRTTAIATAIAGISCYAVLAAALPDRLCVEAPNPWITDCQLIDEVWTCIKYHATEGSPPQTCVNSNGWTCLVTLNETITVEAAASGCNATGSGTHTCDNSWGPWSEPQSASATR